ncbi:hypothetical protein QTN25_007546 [Entamoeba marina]
MEEVTIDSKFNKLYHDIWSCVDSLKYLASVSSINNTSSSNCLEQSLKFDERITLLKEITSKHTDIIRHCKHFVSVLDDVLCCVIDFEEKEVNVCDYYKKIIDYYVDKEIKTNELKKEFVIAENLFKQKQENYLCELKHKKKRFENCKQTLKQKKEYHVPIHRELTIDETTIDSFTLKTQYVFQTLLSWCQAKTASIIYDSDIDDGVENSRRWVPTKQRKEGIDIQSFNYDWMYGIGGIGDGSFYIDKINTKMSRCYKLSSAYPMNDLDLNGTTDIFFTTERVVIVEME